MIARNRELEFKALKSSGEITLELVLCPECGKPFMAPKPGKDSASLLDELYGADRKTVCPQCGKHIGVMALLYKDKNWGLML